MADYALANPPYGLPDGVRVAINMASMLPDTADELSLGPEAHPRLGAAGRRKHI